MSNPKRKEIFVLLLCLLLGFALRFHTFDQKSLWMDEVHTFNDPRDDFRGQIRFYKENPSCLQSPLFFILTHQFYPFPKAERDIRLIEIIYIFSITLVQIRFLKAAYFGQHNEDGTMINPIMLLNTLFFGLLTAYKQSFAPVILDSKMYA